MDCFPSLGEPGHAQDDEGFFALEVDINISLAGEFDNEANFTISVSDTEDNEYSIWFSALGDFPASNTEIIKVLYLPTEIDLTYNGRNSFPFEGESVKVSCSAVSNPPVQPIISQMGNFRI